MSEQRNLLLAIVVSVAILMGFQFAFGPTQPPSDIQSGGEEPFGAPQVSGNPEATNVSELEVSSISEVDKGVDEQPRILINPGNPEAKVSGSITLRGARIDQIILGGYQ